MEVNTGNITSISRARLFFRKPGFSPAKPSTSGNKGILIRVIFLALSCLILASCARAGHTPACIPQFPYRDGWYGGDGAYSIRLPDGRVLWLFGDSFVSEEEGRHDRRGMHLLLGTTVAISTCDDNGPFHIRYHIKKASGKFVSFFANDNWLWPQAPFIVEGILYVPLIAVTEDRSAPGPFKFKVTGHRLAIIRNVSDPDPTRWAIEYRDLSPRIPSNIYAFATASVVGKGYVYFFPLIEALTEGREAVMGNALARLPIDKLEAPQAAIEYLTINGQWNGHPSPTEIRIVLDAAVSEMSVRHLPGEDIWLAVYLSLRNNGDRMLYRTATGLAGPWSEPRVLIAPIPEVDPKSARYAATTFCYAGKEHPQFAYDDRIVVTYVCNSFENCESGECPLLNNLDLYRPIVETPRRPAGETLTIVTPSHSSP